MAAPPSFIDALLDETARALVASATPAHDVVLVPSRFTVVLSYDLYAEHEAIFPFIRDQVGRRLDAELEALRESRDRGWRKWFRSRRPPMSYERGHDDWSIRFAQDPEGRLSGGQFQVYAALSVEPETEALPGGALATRMVASDAAAPGGAQTVLNPSAALAKGDPLAVVRYTDDDGEHELTIGDTYRQRVIKVGRVVGPDDWRDIPISVEADVSRDHARLRFDEGAGRFEIQDRSQFGTTLDGEPVPPASDPHAPGEWVVVPPDAEIVLAGAVTLYFRQVGGRGDA